MTHNVFKLSHLIRSILLTSVIALPSAAAFAQSLSVNTYDIGSPAFTDLYVNGASGNDNSSGLSPSSALRTPDAAWRRIPQGTALTTGYRVNFAGGIYPEASLPNYWESRHGTYASPILFRPIEGTGTVTFGGDINMFDTSYFYLLDISVIPAPAGDAFHCEQCDHILLRRAVMSGGAREAHETVKVNQSQYIYIEDSDIHGADDNAIDFVAVQYGHIVRNRIHDSQDWCTYVKGGSAYITLESNEIYDCGTGGFTAGQGTGFEFMTAPWIHYEAYDIKFFNNIIRDTEGAAFGVNGGYNILMAHNTAYRVGSRDHVIEVVFGARSCDGNAAQCNARRLAGGWGPGSAESDSDDKSVPNKNVFIFNNIVYNPAGFPAPQQIFAIYGPRATRPGLNLPNPAYADDNLQIRGNIIWNLNPSGIELGAGGDGQGCASANPTCSAAQLVRDNTMNIFEPQLLNPASTGSDRDFRPTAGGSIFSVPTGVPTAFAGGDRPATPPSPAGNLENTVMTDRGGETRVASAPVTGAYVSAESRRDPIPGTPGAPGGNDGGGSGGGSGGGTGGSGDMVAPTIPKAKVPKKAKLTKRITLEATVRDNVGVARVFATVGSVDVELQPTGKASKHKYSAKYRTMERGTFDVIITAVDGSNNVAQAYAGRLVVR